MHHPDHNASPFNALPPVAVVAAVIMAGVELVVSAGQAGLVGGRMSVGWRVEMLERFAFSGPLWKWMMEEPGRLSAMGLARLVTYPFVHGSFTHMLFAVVITVALGKFVGEVFRQAALVAVWLAGAVCGALGFAYLTGTQEPLFGGMAPAYGLIGAFTFIGWQKARIMGTPPWLAFRLIGLLLLLQLAFSTMQGGVSSQIVAELCAFAAGFALSFVVRPGGWQATMAVMRQR